MFFRLKHLRSGLKFILVPLRNSPLLTGAIAIPTAAIAVFIFLGFQDSRSDVLGLQNNVWLTINRTGRTIHIGPMDAPKSDGGQFIPHLFENEASPTVWAYTVRNRNVEELLVSYGYTDKAGQCLFPPRFLKASEFKDGVAAVQGLHGWGFIDQKGKIVAAVRDAASLALPSEGLASYSVYIGPPGFHELQLTGLIDTKGNIILPPKYERIEPFSEGLAAYAITTRTVVPRFGFLNRKGKSVIEPKFASVGKFSEGLCPAQSVDNGKWGYINSTGRWVIHPQFRAAKDFAEGLAAAAIEAKIKQIRYKTHPFYEDILDDLFRDRTQSVNRFGYITSDGVWQIEPRFLEASNFSEGKAEVYLSKDRDWYPRDWVCGTIQRQMEPILRAKSKSIPLWDGLTKD